jgi:hypothetical protein
MLKITVVTKEESFDEKKNEFIPPITVDLKMEHSLVSLSKWESKWCKPFLSTSDKTDEEILDYIKQMTVTQNIKDEVFEKISVKNIKVIEEYINSKMTATKISSKNKKTSRQIITSELIYFWMISLNIPFECQKWHLNRLLMLIDVCNVKNAPPKKMSKKDIYSMNSRINEARKAKYNTKG